MYHIDIANKNVQNMGKCDYANLFCYLNVSKEKLNPHKCNIVICYCRYLVTIYSNSLTKLSLSHIIITNK